MPVTRTLDRQALSLLAIGHLLNDVNQGAVPALLPFLVSEQKFSFVAASGIVLAVTIISGVIQPILGYYSDRRSLAWLIPIGMLLGGVGIAFAGTVSNYWSIIACMLISGAGVAAFHPESYRFANYVSGDERATGMSLFTVGGNLGFALGPILLTGAVLIFGMPGTLVLAAPAGVYALILLMSLKHITRYRPTRAELHNNARANPTHWVAFFTIVGVIVLRTIVQYGLLAFVPLYLNHIRLVPIAQANAALVLISVAGAVGTLIAGRLADRLGYKRILVVLLLAITPLLLLFGNLSGLPALAALALAGMATAASFSVAVVLGQAYAESNLGVASGLTTGLAIGLGGLSSPLLGRIADTYGLATVLLLLTFIPLAAGAVALTLPGKPHVALKREINIDSVDLAP
jgi:FSR family fosmidomycin resistance protein-like MFS transporter